MKKLNNKNLMLRKKIKKIVAGGLFVTVFLGVLHINEVFVNKEGKTSSASSMLSDEVIEFDYNMKSIDPEGVCLRNKAVYKTEYFTNSSTEYNHELAKLSLAMAGVSGSTAESVDNWGVDFKDVADTSYKNIDYKTNRNGYLVDVYKKLGFYNDEYKKYEVSLNDNSDTGAYSIAMKNIIVKGKKHTLVICNSRSNGYGAEWGNNFMMYNKDGVSGFESAGREFYESIKSYLKKHKLGENTKIWIMGYSRGAAIANVASALLVNDISKGKYRFSRENVYSYLFATPQSVIDEKYNDEIYNNIFNVVNEADLVIKTSSSYWGFRRYGIDVVIPQLYITDKELKKIEEGKKVSIDEESVELIKKVSREYNIFRYKNNITYKEDVDLDKIYLGFTVNKDFMKIIDKFYEVVSDDVEGYTTVCQDLLVDMLPFINKRVKRYNEKENKYEEYESVTQYLCESYGDDIYTEATKAGVFSQTEYTKKIKDINKMYENKLINVEKKALLEQSVDNYYAYRIIAFKYGLDGEYIKKLLMNFIKTYWNMVLEFDMKDLTRCANVHYAEFYMAWMNNYNPYTKTVVN